MRPYDLIARKRDGGEHTPDELNELVRVVVSGEMPDYQVAAWLMAAYLRGLSQNETLALTLTMRDSGEKMRLDDVPGIKLDKHSSGGVGDKTTLAVVPLLAAAGVPMLKMSGRGLGYSGGTIDKLEAIPGFRTDLDPEAAKAQVKRIGAALVGQSPALVPADKKFYALRDVTATVESTPLIAASIMSKKLAGGANAVLLDVKVGRGAFMKTVERARSLARLMVAIGEGAGVRTRALLTAMEEPLGRAVGNALEVAEACALLTDPANAEPRFRALCLELAAHGLVLAGRATSVEAGRQFAQQRLVSGEAARKLEQIISAQGGDPRVVQEPDRLPRAEKAAIVKATSSGWVRSIDAEAVGRLAMALGAGRERKEDVIDPAAGIVLRRKVGERVEIGEPLAELYASARALDAAGAPALVERLRDAYSIGEKPEETPVVIEVIGEGA